MSATGCSDVIVVGAGVAGSTAASLLAREGFRILLLDKARFPRDKVCGEGLMPHGVKILKTLGLPIDFGDLGGRSFAGIRFWVDGKGTVDLDFTSLSPELRGWAFPRLQLDNALAAHAARQPNVVFLEEFSIDRAGVDGSGVRVEGRHRGEFRSFEGRVLIGAGGIRCRLARRFGIERIAARFRRFGLRRFFSEYRGDRSRVDVHCTARGEAYVAPRPDQGALVTLLLESSALESHSGRDSIYDHRLRAFPRLRRLLSNPADADSVQAWAPLGMRLARCHGHRFLLAGDAAGAVDPVTGQGMTVALRDASLCVEILSDRLKADRLAGADLAEYTQRRNSYFLPAYRLTEDLLTAMRRPLLARQTVRCLNRNHALRRKVLAMAAHHGPPQTLTWLDKARILAGA